MRTLNRIGFADMGFGYYGWLVTVFSTVIRVALAHNCSLIFYAEDGEVEYGGSTENKNKSLFGLDYMKAKYFEGGYEKVMNQVSYTDQEMYYWKFPKESELVDKNLFLTHWGYFEDWDPYRNYLVAKEHCGLQELESRHIDTFQNFGQTDQMLIHLHVYMMYLKLGFGRTTQDVGIEVRRDAMTRDQAVNLVRLYDGTYPEECIDIYLDYFQITQEEFDSILDKWANKELFEKIDNRWKPKFIVK